MADSYTSPVVTLTGLTIGSDISSAISAAVTTLGAGGGLIRIPAGNYQVLTNFTFTTPITIEGAGRREFVGSPGGTMLTRPAGGTASMFRFSGNNARQGGITNLCFDEGYTTIPSLSAQFLIEIDGASSVHLENIAGFRVAKFISCVRSGRATFRKIFGDPLVTGIYIHIALDVSVIEDVHFWPFNPMSVEVQQFRQDNAVAIKIGRADGLWINNVFCLGYHRGIFFGPFPADSSGTPYIPPSTEFGSRNVHINSLYADFTSIGVLIQQTFSKIFIDYLVCQGQRIAQEPPNSVSWGFALSTFQCNNSYVVVNQLGAEWYPRGFFQIGGSGNVLDLMSASGSELNKSAGAAWVPYDVQSGNMFVDRTRPFFGNTSGVPYNGSGSTIRGTWTSPSPSTPM